MAGEEPPRRSPGGAAAAAVSAASASAAALSESGQVDTLQKIERAYDALCAQVVHLAAAEVNTVHLEHYPARARLKR